MDPTLPCGNTVGLTIDVTTSAGRPRLDHPATRTGAAARPGHAYNSTDVPKAIPDDDPTGVTSNLTIGTVAVNDLDVRIGGVDHGFVSDLAIDLISPAGTTVRLFNHHGGAGTT